MSKSRSFVADYGVAQEHATLALDAAVMVADVLATCAARSEDAQASRAALLALECAHRLVLLVSIADALEERERSREHLELAG